jgi:hypothetical protein
MRLKKIPLPRNIPIHEMQMIIGGKKRGMTHKEIKSLVDNTRKAIGTYKGKGISTNTVSRMLGKTHSEAFVKSTELAWDVHRRKERQKSAFEGTRDRILASGDHKSLKRFDKMAERIVNRGKGRQYDLTAEYDAETDEYYVTTG